MKRKLTKKVATKEFNELVNLERNYAKISVRCVKIAENFDIKEIAMRMGNFSVIKLKRLLKKGMAYEAKYEELQKFLWACGYEMSSGIRKKRNKT